MFREMRRRDRFLSEQESIDVLNNCTSGVLAVIGDNNYPYAVPLSYIYYNSKIYFHCATTGHKLDAIRNNSKVSFCIVDKDEVVPEQYTTNFRSVICFGKAHIVEDDGEKRASIEKLAIKYAPNDTEAHRNDTITRTFSAMCMVRIDIEHISGKHRVDK